MKVRKEWIGSKKAATKGDLAELQEDIHVDLQQFATKKDLKEAVENLATKDDLRGLATKEDLRGVMTKETGAELLEYIKSIDQKLKSQHDLPERVGKLETRVFKLELKR